MKNGGNTLQLRSHEIGGDWKT